MAPTTGTQAINTCLLGDYIALTHLFQQKTQLPYEGQVLETSTPVHRRGASHKPHVTHRPIGNDKQSKVRRDGNKMENTAEMEHDVIGAGRDQVHQACYRDSFVDEQ